MLLDLDAEVNMCQLQDMPTIDMLFIILFTHVNISAYVLQQMYADKLYHMNAHCSEELFLAKRYRR